jgi:zinc protease
MVTRQDIQRVAQRYFSSDSLSLVLLGAATDAPLPTAVEVKTLCEQLDTKPVLVLPPAKRDGQVSFTTLDNGVRLIVKEHHAVPVMALQAVMLGGLLFENEQTMGINNMLAGLLTRGSERFSRLELAEAVESLAGSLRGFSGRNSLGLSGSFLTTPRIDNALDLFLDTLLHPAFPAEEVEKRRREILLALKNREDDLAQIAFDLCYETLFTTHPYRFSVLGSEESIRALQREQLIDYYGVLLNPERLVISVVGDVDTDQVTAHFREALMHLPTAVAAPTLPPPDPRPTTARQHHKAIEKQQAHIVLGFQGVTLANPDRYPLKVLEAILSRQGGRLFYELREQRALAYSVTAFGVEGLAPGVVGVYVGTDPNKVEEATTAARAELARVREELVSPAELEQALKYLTGSFEISLQSNSAQSEEMAFNELYSLGYENGRRYLAAINAVTAEDLRRVAQMYFDDNASTLVVVGR